MKIALFDSFPQLEITAEREFMKRCEVVMTRLGHTVRIAANSTDLYSFKPDLVFILHELTPKLTEHFTIGVLWSPLIFSEYDTQRCKNIASWDAVVTASQRLEDFARDLFFPLKTGFVISETRIYPSCNILPPLEANQDEDLSLCYVGAHWDRDRHKNLFSELTNYTDLSVYGPEEAWSYLANAYKGSFPVDGISLPMGLRKHGIVLCIQKDTHRFENMPSMRIFEACAAGCLVISDRLPFISAAFGDSIYYVDPSNLPRTAAQNIADIVAKIKSDRRAAAAKAQEANRIFARDFALDVLIPPLLERSLNLKTTKSTSDASISPQPAIDVIIRCGNRPLNIIDRAVDSLRRQIYTNINIVFVRFRPIDGFDAYVEVLRASGRFKKVDVVDSYNSTSRSNTLWRGFAVVDAPLFAILDDDDELFPQHYADIVPLIEDRHPVVFSGGIINEEEVGPGAARDHRGPHETRRLSLFDEFDRERMVRGDNVVLSHSFVARSSLLDSAALQDPFLDLIEDLYFHMLLIARGATYLFNQRASCIWNWRSVSLGNSEHLPEAQPRSKNLMLRRIFRRLRRLGISDQTGFPTREQAYHSTLDEGIDFTRSGMPYFIEDYGGLGTLEPFGRWSIGGEAFFQFYDPLPEEFRLEVDVAIYHGWHDRTVEFCVGDTRRSVILKQQGETCIAVELQNHARGDRLTLRVTNPVVPPSDTRRIAFAYKKLRILPPSANSETAMQGAPSFKSASIRFLRNLLTSKT